MRGTAASDSELLDCFVKERDSVAFRNLVVRHGPVVLQVCRAVLQDPHEADDTFQATFLVLVRKAPSIQDPESLGGWLRGVAYRTAVRSRCRTARRRVIERTLADKSPSEHSHEKLAPELRQMIREELDRIPDSYRQALTLCYLEGLTHQEAASRLWSALALTAILLGFTGSTALAFHGRLVPDVDPTTLPSNLTDVFNVDCS
jgi:RNA polymerase sigma factor (sigma-70 family)